VKISDANIRRIIREEIRYSLNEISDEEAEKVLGRELETSFCRVGASDLKRLTLADIKKYGGRVPSYYSSKINIATTPPIKAEDLVSITSNFAGPGRPGHKGIDYAANAGTPIYAVADGVVRKIYTNPDAVNGYGVDIDHGHGADCVNHSSQYIHMFELPWSGERDEKGKRIPGKNLRVGQEIKKGDHIGRVGNTGASRGAHLHFQIMQNGVAVNPILFREDDPYAAARERGWKGEMIEDEEEHEE